MMVPLLSRLPSWVRDQWDCTFWELYRTVKVDFSAGRGAGPPGCFAAPLQHRGPQSHTPRTKTHRTPFDGLPESSSDLYVTYSS